MWYKRMELEVWFDRYQYETRYDIGESAVKTLQLKETGMDLREEYLRYGYHTGRPSLRSVIAEEYPGLSDSHIVVTNGASEANFVIVNAMVKPGDHVIIEHPNYPSLYDVPRSLGCDVTLFRLKYENGFKPDFDELESMIRPETKLISLTHPNNPTGSMITEEELKRAVEIAERHNVILMFDETYRQMAFGDILLPAAASLSDQAVSISSMSKVYGLPGIRIGWLATRNREILEQALTIREQVTITNTALGEAIAEKVLREKEVWLKKARERILFNRKVVEEWMEQQEDFEWVFPEAGVVSLPRIKKEVRVDYEKLFRLLAEKYKTFTIPGRLFEMEDHYFRLGFGSNPEEIRKGLENLNQALGETRE